MRQLTTVLIDTTRSDIFAHCVAATWTDAHIPRTEKPVRFYPKGRPAPYPGPTDVCVELAYGSTFRMSEPVRVY